MIIYSVTISIDANMEAEWVAWMKEVHVPDVMSTGYFHESRFMRLLEPVVAPGFSTFNIQYICESIQKYEAYQENEAPSLQQEHTQRFKDRFTAFRTILKQM